MDYETIDWDAEARRVARAFRVKGACVFRAEHDERVLHSVEKANKDYHKQPLIEPRRYLLASYEGDNRYFEIYNSFASQCTAIGFSDNKILRHVSADLSFANDMARALYYLDLLTPEVEVVLGVDISAHERTEWTLERERIMRL